MATENDLETVFYSLPLGETTDGEQPLFLLQRDGAVFMPVFRNKESLEAFFTQHNCLAYSILQSTLSTLPDTLATLCSPEQMKTTGFVIEPLSEHPVLLTPRAAADIPDGFAREANHFMWPTLSGLGFVLEQVDAHVTYGERPASAIFYRGPDCKLQICQSDREGSINFMLAPLNAPNEFGLINRSKQWTRMLALSDLDDELGLPPLGEGTDAVWAWLKALFDTHFQNARENLLRR